ncbi:hypothetical protein LTR47_006992 [Exophiala xenobiotica]|nr:hypothetical protein LTR47_006992 [Exophiala xenobiotica]KAK5246279.1 hypothetical protein LTS06_008436 [Exophiala xenobiotica]KAK5353675.1 hypothetical protein LTR61_002369 [Exophiala xenobiotica]KAK5362323.1 hypothetical protein LTS03_010073 [Exophiala xenobiotica]KAK5370484.1 hypothetical protein LTR11_006695 [Exophiala xenobiotica]
MGFTTLRGDALVNAITCASAACFLLFGYDNGVFAGIINTEAFLSQFNYPSSTLTGTIVSIYNLGCFLGCIIAGLIGRRLGRRLTIIASQWVCIVGTILQCTAFTVGHLIVGRIVTGVATGMATSTIPTWVSETARANRRGPLVALQLAIVSGGILIAYWLDYGMLYAVGQVVWRFPVAFQAVFSIATICMVYFLPESPRLLYDKGRTEEADQILCRLKDKPIDHPDIIRERTEILAAIELEHSLPKMTVRRLLFEPSELKLLRRIIIGFSCQCIQQLTGIAVVIGYLPYVAHNEIGLSQNLAQIMGGIGAVIYFIASFPPIYFVERFGRRQCLIFGSIGMTLCWTLLIIFLALGEQRNNKGLLYAGIVMMYIYQIIFAFSWLSVPWIYPPEITPLNVRHIGAAAATSAEWLTAFLVSEVTPTAVTNIGFYYYIVFAVVCAASIPIVYFFYPETAGRTLEEIDMLFAAGSIHGRDFEEASPEKMHDELMDRVAVSFVERTDGETKDIIHV